MSPKPLFFVPQNKWMLLGCYYLSDPRTLRFSVRSGSMRVLRKNHLLIHIHIQLYFYSFSFNVAVILSRKECACNDMFAKILVLNLRHITYLPCTRVNKNLFIYKFRDTEAKYTRFSTLFF